MAQHIVKIKSIDKVTHDVLQIVTEKPAAYISQPTGIKVAYFNKILWCIY